MAANFVRISDLDNEKSYILCLNKAHLAWMAHELDCSHTPVFEVVATLLLNGIDKIKDDGRDCCAELVVYERR